MKLGCVLLFSSADGVKVGAPGVEGIDVEAKVVAHERGPRIESIRYKSKKRVRVHRGGRADLTALEIIAVGGIGLEKEEEQEEAPKSKRRAAKGTPKKKTEAKAEAKAAEPESEPVAEEETEAEKPKRTARRTKKEEK